MRRQICDARVRAAPIADGGCDGPACMHPMCTRALHVCVVPSRVRRMPHVRCLQDGNNIDEAMEVLLREVIARRGVGLVEAPKGTLTQRLPRADARGEAVGVAAPLRSLNPARNALMYADPALLNLHEAVAEKKTCC